MHGLYNGERFTHDLWRIPGEYTGYITFSGDRDGSHTIIAAVIQRKYGAAVVDRSFLGIYDREGKFFEDRKNNR